MHVCVHAYVHVRARACVSLYHRLNDGNKKHMYVCMDVCVCDCSLQKGDRDRVQFLYNTGPAVIFSNAHYAAALENLATAR